MCGIAGQFGPAADPAIVREMTARLRHRGPDGEGFFSDGDAKCFFGHRRLKIIDLSDDAAQPMAHRDGRHWIIFNGEIYNYIELRRELQELGETFQTSSDSEVLLNAFVRWGAAALDRLIGMFAFAVYDQVERSLFVARDRFGVKPLFYFTLPDGTFSFASEIKALLCDPRISRRPNLPAVIDYLNSGSAGHRAPETFFDGVMSLPASHFIRVQGQTITSTRYWLIDPSAPMIPDPDAISLIDTLLDDAVRLRLRSDVPVGTTLSGGIDSTYILDRVHRSGLSDIPVFLCHLPEDPKNEANFARAALASVPHAVPHWVTPSAGDFDSDLAHLFESQEEPFADTSIYAHYCLMREARRNSVPVVLSGQGADEVFVGYPSYYRAFLGSLLREGDWRGFAREWSARSQISKESRSSLAVASLYHAASPSIRNAAYSLRARGMGVPIREDVLNRFRAQRSRFQSHHGSSSSFNVYLVEAIDKWALPHLLSYDDRNSMAFSVESRQPYLDHRLVEALFRLPADMRLRNGWTKALLRVITEGRIDPSITWRRDKTGFSTPMAAWVRSIRHRIEEVLSRPSWLESIIDDRLFAKMTDRFWSGDDSVFQPIWWVFSVRYWSEMFGVTTA